MKIILCNQAATDENEDNEAHEENADNEEETAKDKFSKVAKKITGSEVFPGI